MRRHPFIPRHFVAAPRGMPIPLRSIGCLPVVASLLPPGTALMRLRFAQLPFVSPSLRGIPFPLSASDLSCSRGKTPIIRAKPPLGPSLRGKPLIIRAKSSNHHCFGRGAVFHAVVPRGLEQRRASVAVSRSCPPPLNHGSGAQNAIPRHSLLQAPRDCTPSWL